MAADSPAESFDVVYIGGGPGGYTGAIRAAQLGLKTALIEKGKTLGGTCLNVGCIPSKALLDSSEHYAAALHEFKDHGILIEKVKLNLEQLLARKDKIVKDLTGGVAFLMKKNKITVITGTAQLVSPNEIQVISSEGQKQIVAAKNIVLATGSVVNDLPSVPVDGKSVITSTEALSLPKVPEHLIVIGGGVIGLELGSVWLRLGAQVTVLEYADRLCPSMDQQMTKKLETVMTKQGMKFMFQVKVTGAKDSGKGVQVSFEDLQSKEQKSITGDVVLVATGRRPFSDGLGLEKVGIQKDKRGAVQVNEHYQTAVPNIFAIGDLIPGPMLAHKAEEEGVAVAEILGGHAGHVNYETVPSVIYTWPELASVGYSEEQLKEKGVQYKAGSFPFTANGRAKALGMTDGLVKILANANTDRVLGVHVLGPRASDVLAEAVIAMEFSASSEDIARSFHGHPTLSEVMREAALAVDKRARQG
jgi:dihydrolipoamide dehydrogenase